MRVPLRAEMRALTHGFGDRWSTYGWMGFTPLYESPLRGHRGRDDRSDLDDSGVVIGDEWSIAGLSGGEC